jgi:peptidyl-prolyl cis-trans isomerase SDCCAG10
MAGPTAYITEPPTRGKVVLRTAAHGDVEIELWPKEAPLACRNFVQLALEGYYDGLTFHRVIKELLMQTGSPDGSGTDGGGDATIYGAAFRDELHQRLKFNHRGQVAMANQNTPNSNGTQFFIFLGNKADWLDKKHTIFGKVTGPTIFNAIRASEVETDTDDRPVDPLRLVRVDVIDNPFDDIVPRTAARAAAEAASKAAAEADAKAARARTAKRASNLLSFGEGEEEEEGGGGSGGGRAAPGKGAGSSAAAPAARVKVMAAHELLRGDASLAADVAAEDVGLQEEARRRQRKAAAARAAAAAASSAAAQPRGAGAAASASSASSSGWRGDDEGGDDGDGGESADFAASMRQAIKAKRARYEGSGSGSSAAATDAAAAAPPPPSTAPVAAGGGASSSSFAAVQAAAGEYQRLRDELRASRRAATVLTGPAARQEEAQRADSSLLTPLQQMRSKYKSRGGADAKARESSTLDRLAAFQATLRAAAAAAAKAPDAAAASSSSAAADTGYHGQVLEDDGKDDETAGAGGGADAAVAWMAHKLKFKKHIDDAYRAGNVDDGLVTIDDSAGGGGGDRPTSYGAGGSGRHRDGGDDRRR